MLDSGDNEFIYNQVKDGIDKGIFNITEKEHENCYSKEEIEKWKKHNK